VVQRWPSLLRISLGISPDKAGQVESPRASEHVL